MPRHSRKHKLQLPNKEARQIRDFVEKSSRTWLRPPYYIPSQILAFFVMGIVLFFGYTSTRLAMIKKEGFQTQQVWVDGNMFIIVVVLLFIPSSVWYCCFGWKRQAKREKKLVKDMMYDAVKKVLNENKREQEATTEAVMQIAKKVHEMESVEE